jgi:hypothetical protein
LQWLAKTRCAAIQNWQKLIHHYYGKRASASSRRAELEYEARERSDLPYDSFRCGGVLEEMNALLVFGRS